MVNDLILIVFTIATYEHERTRAWRCSTFLVRGTICSRRIALLRPRRTMATRRGGRSRRPEGKKKMSEMAFFLASHGRQKFATSLSMMISAGARLAPSSFPFGRKDAIMMNGGHLIPLLRPLLRLTRNRAVIIKRGERNAKSYTTHQKVGR